VRYNQITALSGSSTTVSFNAASGDTLLIDPAKCSGLDGTGPLRTNVENSPGASGGLVFAPLLGPRPFTLGGLVQITSSGTESGYISAADTLMASLTTCLGELAVAAGTLTWTGHTLSVVYNTELEFPTIFGVVKGFQFGLIAANPTPA
jgi:hypothetical protein